MILVAILYSIKANINCIHCRARMHSLHLADDLFLYVEEVGHDLDAMAASSNVAVEERQGLPKQTSINAVDKEKKSSSEIL